LTLYLDTSVLLPLFVVDPLNRRAETLMRQQKSVIAISDYCIAEFASAIAARVRSGEIPSRIAQIAYSQFDGWTAGKAKRTEMMAADISAAASFIRRLDLPLKTGDAIHIAVAQRLGATLATFDRQMEAGAGVLGVPVAAR
jgi:predicted nucleic acid-binding protein